MRVPEATSGMLARGIGIVALAVGAGPAWAYLVDNAAFDQNLDGWTQAQGTWSHRADDGVFGLGSAEIVSTGAGSGSIHQCTDLTTDVSAGHGLYAFGFGRTVNHTNAVLLSLELFATDDCTGGAIDTQQFQVFPAMDTWSFVHTVGTAPGGAARSARLWATAFSSAADQVTRIDLLGLTHNAHFNPDFNDSLDSWVETGAWVHAAGEGFGTPAGAAQVEIEDVDCGGGNACAFLSQCLNLTGTLRATPLFAGGAFKALDNTEDLVISHFFYPEPGCGGTALVQTGVGASLTQVGVWQRFTGNFAVPAGALSVSVFVGANDGTPGDRFLVDSLYLAPSVNEILVREGFESDE